MSSSKKNVVKTLCSQNNSLFKNDNEIPTCILVGIKELDSSNECGLFNECFSLLFNEDTLSWDNVRGDYQC